LTDEVASAAEVATGAAAARAVEPAAGESSASASQPRCLNCGAALQGRAYCAGCGQSAKVHRTLGAFAHDALHSVLHLDGKIWRTLPLLVWSPGELTRRYIHGERAKFVSPLALFLFCVVLAFASINWFASDINVQTGSGSPPSIRKAIEADRAQFEAELKDLEAERAKAQAENEPAVALAAMDVAIAQMRATFDQDHGDAQSKLRRMEVVSKRLAEQALQNQNEVERLEKLVSAAEAASAPVASLQDQLAIEKFNQRATAQAQELLDTQGLSAPKIRVNTGSEQLNESVKKSFKNPQLFLYKLQTNAYKFAWALIPISMPFVWLLFFWRREFKLFDHAVFVTYSLCFMLVFLALCAVMSQFGPMEAVVAMASFFVPPVHMYRQVRHAYGLSVKSALWRTCLLMLFALVAVGLFMTVVLAMGAA
jgi:hypothetical protein